MQVTSNGRSSENPASETTRWTRPHFPPNSLAISPNNVSTDSRCSSEIGNMDASFPLSATKQESFSVTTKQALGRFFLSAKRALSLDTLSLKSSELQKFGGKKKNSVAKVRPAISYPMKLHHPGPFFSAAQDPWAYQGPVKKFEHFTRRITATTFPRREPGWRLKGFHDARRITSFKHSADTSGFQRGSQFTAPETKSSDEYEFVLPDLAFLSQASRRDAGINPAPRSSFSDLLEFNEYQALAPSEGQLAEKDLGSSLEPPSQSSSSSKARDSGTNDSYRWMNFETIIPNEVPSCGVANTEGDIKLSFIESFPHDSTLSKSPFPDVTSEKFPEDRCEMPCSRKSFFRNLKRDEQCTELARLIDDQKA